MTKPITLRARQLRTVSPLPETIEQLPRLDLYIIVEDVLDTYNVGAIFRVADSLAVKKVYLCGRTLTPPNTKIKNASVNTWQWVPWEYCESATEAIKKLRIEVPDVFVAAIEQAAESVLYYKTKYTLPTALIVGNETRGIDQKTLSATDAIIELPMYGVNASLNVIASLAVVAFHVAHTTIDS